MTALSCLNGTSRFHRGRDGERVPVAENVEQRIVVSSGEYRDARKTCEAAEPAKDPVVAGLTYTAMGLPAGLSLTAQGAIHGLLTETGTSTVTLSAQGSAGPPKTVTFLWIVI